MQREYPIKDDGEIVGTAHIAAQGLYYEVQCICKMQHSVLHIEADCGNRKENIGICVPNNGKMVIRTRVPQKRLAGLVGFAVRRAACESWIPINAEEPLKFLWRIAEARFAIRDGRPGLWLPNEK
ncbi:MAG: hypothetical protein E7461_01390 [Ruminococcaceae bacterium]|nr:hypothetical protein [Oscillospiraceae bacterium]